VARRNDLPRAAAFEHATLVAIAGHESRGGTRPHRLGAELPGLQPGELERNALDLGVAPLDGLGLRADSLGLSVDVLGLLGSVGQHLRCEVGPIARAECLQVLARARIYIRVIDRNCSRRCEGRPKTSALN
jgi:hypothetical protein